MKYLIIESQIDKVIFKYLDNQDFIRTESENNIYFVNSEGDSNFQIRFNKTNSECFINRNLNKEISSFFSLDQSNSNQIIGRWVEVTLQMNVSNVSTAKTPLLSQLKLSKLQIDKIVFKFLDKRNFIQIDEDNKIYFVKSEGDKYSQIRYDKNDGQCFVNAQLVKLISSFFSFDISDVEQTIGRWVENNVKMEVSNIRVGPIKRS